MSLRQPFGTLDQRHGLQKNRFVVFPFFFYPESAQHLKPNIQSFLSVSETTFESKLREILIQFDTFSYLPPQEVPLFEFLNLNLRLASKQSELVSSHCLTVSFLHFPIFVLRASRNLILCFNENLIADIKNVTSFLRTFLHLSKSLLSSMTRSNFY